MNALKWFENWLIGRGLLHSAHTRSERLAGIWTALSILILLALIAIVVVDELFLGRSLYAVLRPFGIAALVSFGVGCLLIVLSTNHII